MPLVPDHLEPRPGESIAQWYQRFKEWTNGFEIFEPSGDITIDHQPEGKWINSHVIPNSYSPFFPCSLQGPAKVLIGRGTVNDKVPTLNGLPIDGLDAATGQRLGPAPTLDLKGATPNAEMRSWVVVRSRINPYTQQYDPKDKLALTIAHTNDLSAKLPDIDTGQQALAEILWRSQSAAQQIFQITTHNLKHQATPPGKPRHFFIGI